MLSQINWQILLFVMVNHRVQCATPEPDVRLSPLRGFMGEKAGINKSYAASGAYWQQRQRNAPFR